MLVIVCVVTPEAHFLFEEEETTRKLPPWLFCTTNLLLTTVSSACLQCGFILGATQTLGMKLFWLYFWCYPETKNEAKASACIYCIQLHCPLWTGLRTNFLAEF